MISLTKNTLIVTLAIVVLTSLISCGGRGNHSKVFREEVGDEVSIKQPVTIVDSSAVGLVFYYPPTDSIALRCFVRPEPTKDPDIVFCCAAAFTLDYEKAADHKRICSAHVSEGTYYPKPRIKRNTGAFITYNGSWTFLYQADADPAAFETEFRNAAANKGAGFAQEMMIHNGKQIPTTRPLNNTNLFRALCKRGGHLCIADATENKTFGAFIQSLIDAGVTEALYTDMGGGWNYSWYRVFAKESATFIHPTYQEAATNWIVFYSK